MVNITWSLNFEKNYRKVRDSKTKERVNKNIKKIIKNPEAGLFLTHRKGERKIYIPRFRLLYAYDKSKNEIYLIDFDRRDKIYKK